MCAVQIRCYVGEQCSTDSGGVEPRTIQSMVVNGEEHCCNGNYSSWTREGSATCNMCPTPGKCSHIIVANYYIKCMHASLIVCKCD